MGLNLTLPWLFATMTASTVGFGVFTYGRKELRLPQIVIGLILMIVPGFLGSTALVWGILFGLLAVLWIGTRAGL
jgi:hypothetical protein